MPVVTATIHDRLETDFKTYIVNLNLLSTTGKTGSIGQNVIVQNLLEKLHVPSWPAVLITAQALSEEEEDGSFEEDYVVYPVMILICDVSRPQIQQCRADYLAWRHAIAQHLRGLVNYPLLPNCPEMQDVRVRNNPILPDSMAVKEYVQSGLIALCHTTEPRLRNGA